MHATASTARTYHLLHQVVQNHIALWQLEPEATAATLIQIPGDCGVTIRRHGYDVSGYPAACLWWLTQRLPEASPCTWPGDWEQPAAGGQYRLYQALAQLLTELGEPEGMDLLMLDGVVAVLWLLADVLLALGDDMTQVIVDEVVGESLVAYLASH